MNGTSIEISLPSPETNVSIVPNGVDERGVCRFSENLRHVWSRIPESDRLVISTYWKKGHSGPNFPCFGVIDYFSEEASASTLSNGFTIRFCWQEVSLSPDNALIALIAHEMAHVHQWASGKRLSLTNEDVKGMFGIEKGDYLPLLNREGRVELHADELMTKWGFDRLAYPCWLMQWNPTITDHGIALRKKPWTEKYARKKANDKRLRQYLWLGYLKAAESTSAGNSAKF